MSTTITLRNAGDILRSTARREEILRRSNVATCHVDWHNRSIAEAIDMIEAINEDKLPIVESAIQMLQDGASIQKVSEHLCALSDDDVIRWSRQVLAIALKMAEIA